MIDPSRQLHISIGAPSFVACSLLIITRRDDLLVLDLAISVTPDLGANSGLVYSLVSLFEQCPKEFILLGRVRNPRGLSRKGSCAQPPLPPTQPQLWVHRTCLPYGTGSWSPFTPYFCGSARRFLPRPRKDESGGADRSGVWAAI